MIGGDIFVSLAYRSVRLHLLRSLLAALGIVIGVIAITSLGIMGANLTMSVSAQLSRTANVITVSPYTGGGRGFGAGGGGGESNVNLNITQSQLQDIIQVAGANQVIPIYSNSDRITVGSKVGRASIYGLPPDKVQDLLTVQEGTALRGGDGALVGATLVSDFDLTVGSRIKLGDTSGNSTPNIVRVIGILQSQGASFSINADRALIVTDKWYTSAYGGSGDYSQVQIIANDLSQIGTIINNTDKRLNRNEKLPVVRISSPSQFLSTVTSTLGSITSFMTMLGAISLIVAAVSIFNVMIMSVTERIREIGILRSIGTRKSEIRKMFLYEAIIIGFIGAGVGAILSVVFGYLTVLAIVGNTTYFFTPASLIYIPQGMLIGVATCVLSGVYPAWRASDLDPIEALRAE
ncbi:MAG TPA: ABC transporter permease [Methanomicrobiales archaeon]|nr:ABC transporter permease [Methanomicrobiales archaeon]